MAIVPHPQAFRIRMLHPFEFMNLPKDELGWLWPTTDDLHTHVYAALFDGGQESPSFDYIDRSTEGKYWERV